MMTDERLAEIKAIVDDDRFSWVPSIRWALEETVEEIERLRAETGEDSECGPREQTDEELADQFDRMQTAYLDELKRSWEATEKYVADEVQRKIASKKAKR
jgi:hypothetical protein